MILTRPQQRPSLNPLSWLAVCFCVGITSESLFDIPLWPAVISTLVLACAAFIIRGQRIAAFLLLAVFFGLGITCSQLEKASVSADRIRSLCDSGRLISGDPVEVEGTVESSPEPAPEGFFITLDTDHIVVNAAEQPASGRVRIFVPLSSDEAKLDFNELQIRHSSRVRVACRLEREERYMNPGVYSRKLLLDRQQLDATANLKSPLLIERLSDGNRYSPIGLVADLRAELIQRFRSIFSMQTAGVMIASMLGNKYFLDKQTADVFREGGTFHVLVISGLHITFIGGLILLIVRIFTRRRWTQAAIAISILWLYGIAVGGEPPILRACVMFTILMIGYAEYRSSSLLNALGACTLALLAWRPSDLFDPSFQLTFVSVAAIICVGLPLVTKLKAIGTWMPTAEQPFPPNVPIWLRRLCETIYWRDAAWEIERGRQVWTAEIFKSPFFKRLDDFGLQRIAIFVFEGVIVSAAVQLCLLPMLVYYFHRFPLASIPLNLWVGIVLAAESISALIAAILSMVSTNFAFPFVIFTEICNWLIVTVPSSLGSVVRFSTRIPIYSGNMKAVYFIYFVPNVAVALLITQWDPFSLLARKVWAIRLTTAAFTLTGIFGGLIIFHPFSAPGADGTLHVDFLDVAQGDAAFITFPNGRTMLIDAGGRVDYRKADRDEDEFEPDVPRIGEAVVSEFVWEKGIARVDMIVATHADADHIQGLGDIVRNFSVGVAYFGRLDDDPELKPLLEALDLSGVPKKTIASGDLLNIGDVQINVLNPNGEVAMSANNDSIVLRVVFGSTSIMFTGDIEKEAEASIVNSSSELKADVIKVPHHGSRSSSTDSFVDAVHPEIAIISVGRRSLFGHPHKEVVERWQAAGAKVMTTGECGTISIASDGTNLGIERFCSMNSR